MHTFYYASNTCALASHISLEDAAAEYKAVSISFSDNQQQSENYRKINPKCRVPALATEEGILTETPAILAFIAQTYPDSPVAMPSSAYRWAQIQSFNSYLCSTVHVAHAHRMRGHRWADDPAAIVAMQTKVPHSVGAAFKVIEDELFIGPWVMGEQYSVCDPYIFTLAQWLVGDGVDINEFPKIKEHSARMLSRPSVIAALNQEKS